MNDKTFIESQFPIAQLSAESYKERKAVSGQTLTGLGKWWGRKPLVLVRASILGMLLPASDDPKKDRDIFLKIMTMDPEGVWRRRDGNIPVREILDCASQRFQERWRNAAADEKDDLRDEIWSSLSDKDRTHLETLKSFPLSRTEFQALSYDARIKKCLRPEQFEGPNGKAWSDINSHLGTSASTLQELIAELGERRFGHRPKVGDSFCGGGSIPFEAARMGCEAYGSDLNPVAALLTWASLNLVGGGKAVRKQVRESQARVFKETQATVEGWGIEESEEGWKAEAYLYCVEVKPDGCDYFIPLAPSWVVAEKTKVCAVLGDSPKSGHIPVEIVENADAETWRAAKSKETGTVASRRVIDPLQSGRTWPVEGLRGVNGLRKWGKEDLVPRPSDTLQERLYCIRWRKPDGKRVYRAPTEFDLRNEAKVLKLLQERLENWREKGFIPSSSLPISGEKTEEPIRTRGWTHWHHLFTPRQLLLLGAFAAFVESDNGQRLLPLRGRLANLNSRLCRWLPTQGGGDRRRERHL